MGFSLSSPWLLLLFLIIPLLIWVQLRYTTRLTGGRKIFAIVIRSLILFLVLTLAMGLVPYRQVEQRNLVMLVDRSDSAQLAAVGIANEFASNIISDDERNQLAVMSFGSNIMIDRALSPIIDKEQVLALHTVIDHTGTNIAAALRQAGGLLNAAGGGKLVLITDGHETAGSLVKEAKLLKAMNVTVDVVQLSGHQALKDTAVAGLHVPSQLKQGEKYQISVSVASTYETSAVLYVYEDDQPIVTQSVQLIEGTNTYLIDAVASTAGMKQYRAVIESPEDAKSQNNSAHALSRVEGPAGVLIVEGEKGSSRNIESALAASYIQYVTILPQELSYELSQYVQYDSIIFNNVSAVHLSQQKMDHIESAVRHYGVGFVMLGGNDSYGLGGYFDTPIESILPLNMQLSGKKKIPDLQLMLVIDHSGSMMGSKMELAKEAAARTVELMRAVDTVGVVAFDSIPSWVVKPTRLTAIDEVISNIMSIQPNGGTDIYPALEMAYTGFDSTVPGRKHMILLTDGMSNFSPGYATLLENMIGEGITLSTVAVGSDADVSFLASLAEQGSGRTYVAEDETTLPAIFSREATLMSRAYIVDERVQPLEGYAGSWSQLWSGGVPYIDAYVATSAKDRAEVALWTPQEDPLLSRWQIGSGKSVAFTSDVNGKWSSDWINWEQFPNVFTEWVKWTYPQYSHTPYELKLSQQGKMNISSTTGQMQSNLAMTVEGNDQVAVTPLVPIGNGEYEADIEGLQSGVYFTQIGELAQQEDGGQQVVDGVTTGFVVPYSDEYRLHADVERAAEKLELLTADTGGSIISVEDGEDVYLFEPALHRDQYDWSRAVLLLILALWLVDIGNRRIALPWHSWWVNLKGRLGGGLSAESQQRQHSDRWERLQQRKASLEGRSKQLQGTVSRQTYANDESSNNQQSTSSQQGKSVFPEKRTHSESKLESKRKDSDDPSKLESKRKDSDDPSKLNSIEKASNADPGTESASSSDKMNRLLAAKNRRKP